MTASVWDERSIKAKGLRIREGGRVFKPADLVTLNLPMPPSVNKCWANVAGKGRTRSQDYRRWHKLAFDELSLQKPGKVVGKFAAVITAGRLRAGSDIDNRIKPLLDLLAGTVTDDDALCERVSAGWTDELEAGRITITVRVA